MTVTQARIQLKSATPHSCQLKDKDGNPYGPKHGWSANSWGYTSFERITAFETELQLEEFLIDALMCYNTIDKDVWEKVVKPCLRKDGSLDQKKLPGDLELPG